MNRLKNNKIISIVLSLIVLGVVIIFIVKIIENYKDKNFFDEYRLHPYERDSLTLSYIKNTKINSKIISINVNSFNNRYLIIDVKNNNDITVSHEYLIEIYDEDENIIDTIDYSIIALKPNEEATLVFDIFGNNSNITYNIDLNVKEEQEYKSNKNNIIVNKTNNEKTLLIEFTNNSYDTLDSLQANIILYKDNKIVGIDVINKNLIRSNETINEIINYYEKYNITSFDRCEVIINEAASYIGN